MKPQKYKIGDRFQRADGTIKIMAYADGYYMARKPGCLPFIITEETLNLLHLLIR